MKAIKCLWAIFIATLILSAIFAFACWLIDPDLKDIAHHNPRLQKLYEDNHPYYASYPRMMASFLHTIIAWENRMEVFIGMMLVGVFLLINIYIPILITLENEKINRKRYQSPT